MSQKAALLLEILTTAGEGQICILHGYDTYPNVIPSDVDVLISRLGLRRILQKQFDNWRLVQCLRHEYSCYYLVYASDGSDGPQFLALDAALDHRRDGCVFYRHEEILPLAKFNSRKLPVPPPEFEFAYYVTKRVGKGLIDTQQAKRLRQLWIASPKACREQLARFFPTRSQHLIAEAADTGQWTAANQNIAVLKRSMQRHMSLRQPLTRVIYCFQEVARRLHRIFAATGLVVAFLGPDGSGKSTLIDTLEQWLGGSSEVFRATKRYHFRPHWGRQTVGIPVYNPHEHEARSIFFSLAKLVLWTADYSLGYGFVVWPRVVHSTLVLFDRYFHDVLVDPRRYRYGGASWIPRLVGNLIIKPDLFMILDAPIQITRSRSQEVSIEESERQRPAYISIANQLPNAHLLDASMPPDEIAKEATRIILQYLSERVTSFTPR